MVRELGEAVRLNTVQFATLAAIRRELADVTRRMQRSGYEIDQILADVPPPWQEPDRRTP